MVLLQLFPANIYHLTTICIPCIWSRRVWPLKHLRMFSTTSDNNYIVGLSMIWNVTSRNLITSFDIAMYNCLRFCSFKIFYPAIMWFGVLRQGQININAIQPGHNKAIVVPGSYRATVRSSKKINVIRTTFVSALFSKI